jgi:hypothetical protein
MTFEGLWTTTFEGSMELGFTVRGGWWSAVCAKKSSGFGSSESCSVSKLVVFKTDASAALENLFDVF